MIRATLFIYLFIVGSRECSKDEIDEFSKDEIR
jgi:hypothetical protein